LARTGQRIKPLGILIGSLTTSPLAREHLRGKYHCTVDLLFDQFRNVHLCSTKFSAPSTKENF